jgi:hypothetical protein
VLIGKLPGRTADFLSRRAVGMIRGHRGRFETVPMALLEPARVVRDEGFFRALRFALSVLRDGDARRRVFEMRRVSAATAGR